MIEQLDEPASLGCTDRGGAVQAQLRGSSREGAGRVTGSLVTIQTRRGLIQLLGRRRLSACDKWALLATGGSVRW
jgi:hypothetical protein